MKNGAVALCGFMGCGKSTLGRLLAKKLNREFVDLDRSVELHEGCTVSEIFARFGEEGFRQREYEALCREAPRGDAVLALGGGAVLFPRNVETLRKSGARVVFLDAPVSLLQKRLRNDKVRPLLQRPDREAFIRTLWQEREPLYRAAADVIFPVEDAEKEKNLARLLRALQENT